MKGRTFAILIGVLVILVGIYLLQQFSTGKKSISESMTQLCPGFNASSVKYISVFKEGYPDSGLYFAKKDGKWLVSSYFDAPAKENDMTKLLDDVKSLQGEIRSTRAELFEDYEISDSTALHLEFLSPDSSIIADILVGKGVPQASQSSFLRHAGSDTVYMANQNFLSRFAVWNAEPSKRMPAKRWAEMFITNVEKDQIKSIQLKVKKTTYEFSRNQQASEDTTAPPVFIWEQVKPTRGKKLEDKDIQSLLARLIRVNAKEIIDRAEGSAKQAKPEYGLARPDYMASLITDDGATTTLLIGNEIDTTTNSRYAAVEDLPYIYELAKYNFESLFVNPFKTD